MKSSNCEKCLVIQAAGLEVWMQAKRPHNFVLNAFDVSVSWTMKSVLGPWRTRKGSTERKFPLFVFGSTFFFSHFLLSLSRNYLSLEGFEIILQPGIGHWWTLQQFWSCHQQRTEWGVEPRIIQANPSSLDVFPESKNLCKITGGTLASRSCRYTTAAYWVGYQVASGFFHPKLSLKTLKGTAACDLPWL